MSFPRDPAYRDSGVEWLGEVPAHWDVARLNTVATCNDEVLVESTPEDYEIEYVEISGVQAGQGIVETATLPFGNAPSRARRVVRNGDVLISTVRTYLRAIAQVKNPPENMIASTGFAVLRPCRINSGFLGYACQAEGLVNQVIARSVGVSYPAINASELARLPLLLPSAPEQPAIATFLDHETGKIDALVAEQERLIELLKEKRQAVISHAVTKGLDPSVPMKDSGVEWLGEVPAHWDVCPLKLLARIGNGSTPNRDNPHYWAEDGFPWLNSSVVNQDEVSEAERFVTSIALKECHLPIIEPPAVLVGITGQGKTRGMAAPLTFTATVNQHLAYIKPDQTKLGVTYLLRVIEAAYEHLRTESEGVGSTKGAITCGQLGAWKVPVPDLAEQSEIVSFLGEELNKLDALMNEGALSIELLRERRTALISAAVTGQIDVRGWVPAETAH